MVFFQQKKRSKLPTVADNMATLTDLPIELLFQILGDLDNLSVLRLRLTCSAMLPSCNMVVQQRLKTLYCHPSAKAMKHALSICNHPVYNQTIDEVVILGKVVWRDIEKVYPGYRKHGLGPSPQLASQLKAGRFCFWSEESCGLLTVALEQLPKLKHLTFAEKASPRGWNQVSSAVIDGHYHKYSVKDSTPISQHNMTDANVWFTLLRQPDLHFTSCRMKSELPFLDNVRKALNRDAGLRHLGRSALGSCDLLTTLEITLDCGWASGGDHAPSTEFYHLLLDLCHANLQTLDITLRPNMSIRDLYYDRTLHELLQGLEFPKLETLNIKLQQDSNQPHSRRHRPICCDFSITTFLNNHLDTLEHLKLSNVTFCHTSDDGVEYGVIQHIVAVTSLLVRYSNIEEATWRINRHRHDPRCKRSNEEDPTLCKRRWCGRYESGTSIHRPLVVADLESLAELMCSDYQGLEEKTVSFDLGDIIMRVARPDDDS